MKSANTGPIIAMILALGVAFGAVGWAALDSLRKRLEGVEQRLDLIISEQRDMHRDLTSQLRDLQRDFTPRYDMSLSERVTRVEERVTILEERAREK